MYWKTVENVTNVIIGTLIYIDNILAYVKTLGEPDVMLNSSLNRGRKHSFKLYKEKAKVKVINKIFTFGFVKNDGLSKHIDKIKASYHHISG